MNWRESDGGLDFSKCLELANRRGRLAAPVMISTPHRRLVWALLPPPHLQLHHDLCTPFVDIFAHLSYHELRALHMRFASSTPFMTDGMRKCPC